MPRFLTASLFALALLCLLPAGARADSIEIPSMQQGWYRDDGFDNGIVPGQPGSYFVGVGSGGITRNYFVFNLQIVTGVTSARLMIFKPGWVQLNPDPFETYTLYDVQTPEEQLGRGGGIPVYNDLGSGTIFGSINVPYSHVNSTLFIDLNADALEAIRNNNGLFAIGGAITSFRSPPGMDEGLFGRSGGAPAWLILEGPSVARTPEPATILLLGTGLAGAVQVLRRRRKG